MDLKELKQYEVEKDIFLIQGDCSEILPKLEDKSVDLILTDPPFFLKLDHYKTRKWFKRNFSDLGMIEPFFKSVFDKFEKLLKLTGRFYVFCDGQSYPLFWYHLFNFTKSIRPIIWDKKTSISGYSWRHQHQLILFGEMPQAKPIFTGDGDILRYSAVKVDNRQHPAEKPVDLISALIKKSSKTDNVILDMFMGSGTTGIACKELNRKFIGIEIDKEYYEIAKQRIFNTKRSLF